MDAFSLALFLGVIFNKKTAKKFILLVGIFHFIMPLLGSLVGFKVSNIMSLNGHYVLGIILMILSIQIIISIFKKEEIKNFKGYELILLAFGVSIDSFTLGFGLSFENSNIFFSAIIFSICSILLTCMALIIGKYTTKFIGSFSKIIGAIMLFTFGIFYLFN